MRILFKFLSKISPNKSYRESLLVTVGTVFNSFLGLLFYVLVGRNLSVPDFGYFSFLIALGILAADLGGWGIGAAIVKFGSKELNPVFSLGLLQRICAGVIIFSIATVAQQFFHVNYLLSALVACSLLFLYLITQSLLAKQKYFEFALVNIIGNVIRLIIVIGLLGTQNFVSDAAITAFIGANALAIIFGAFLVRRAIPDLRLDFSRWKETLEQIKHFSAWTGGSFIFSAIASQLDTPLVFSLTGSYQTGLYSSAQKLSVVFPQIASSLDSVFSPKLTREKTHFGDYLQIAILVAGCIILIIPFSSLLISVLWSQYLPAVQTFQILLLGMTLFILTGPFSATILYHHGKSKIYFINSLLQVVSSLVLYLLLIPQLGANGAALTFATVSFISLIYYVSAFIYFRRHV